MINFLIALMAVTAFNVYGARFVASGYDDFVLDKFGRFDFESYTPKDGTVVEFDFDKGELSIDGLVKYTDIEPDRHWTRTDHGKYSLFYAISSDNLDKVAVKVIYMDNGDKYVMLAGTKRARRYKVRKRKALTPNKKTENIR